MGTQSGGLGHVGPNDGRSEALEQFRKDVANLSRFASELGIDLPYSPGFIVEQEWRGHVVDLATGTIVLGGANERYSPVGGCK